MAEPNLTEIEWAIHNLKHEESSKEGYILLAALSICRGLFLENTSSIPAIPAYIEAPVPVIEKRLEQYGDSEFLQAVTGKDKVMVLEIIDELMDTLHAVNAKVYHSVISKLQNLDNNEPPP